MEELKVENKKMELYNQAKLDEMKKEQDVKLANLKLYETNRNHLLEIRKTELANEKDKEDKNFELEIEKLKDKNKTEIKKNLEFDKIKLDQEENLEKLKKNWKIKN